MPRPVNDILENCDELARRFEEYEPRPEDELDPRVLLALRAATDEPSTAHAVATARRSGYSWRLIGSLTGFSDAEVRARYGAAADG